MLSEENLSPVIGDILSEIERQNLRDENRILLIADSRMKIEFVSSFFDRWRLLHSVEDLNTEPDLAALLRIFTKNKINSLNLEVSIDWQEEQGILDYKVDITKLQIANEEYFLLVFESLNKRSKLERKINSLTYALDYGGIPVIITDEKSEIIYSSAKFEEILGIEIEELYLSKLVDVLASYVTLGEMNILKKALELQQPWKKTLIIEQKGKTKYYEFVLLPIFYEENDKQNFILTAHDITDFILKHQEIRRSEKWLHSIIDNISDMLIVLHFDETGQLTLKISNRSFINYIGLQNIIGYSIYDLFEKDEADFLLKHVKKLETKEIPSVKFECKLNEEETTFEAVGTLMFDPIDEKDYYIFVFKDISSRIAYERQLENAFKEEMRLNKMKTEFLENMSHELRTPANAVVGYSEILSDAVEEKDWQLIEEIAPEMKKVILRLIKLFDNIVDVAEAEANKTQIHLEEINLNDALIPIKEEFENIAISKGLEFNVNLFGSDVIVKADKEVLHKIFFSLVDNSVKYTLEGKVTINTSVEKDYGIVEISDTGPGIEEKKLNELIRPFTQGEEGYTRNFQGAGLGLPLAYRLTLLIDGKILINSNSEGTHITLKFPLVKTQNE